MAAPRPALYPGPVARRQRDDVSKDYVVALSVRCPRCAIVHEVVISAGRQTRLTNCSRCGAPMRADRSDLARVITKPDLNAKIPFISVIS